jgi:vacuolar-type H+-ATPase subunit H
VKLVKASETEWETRIAAAKKAADAALAQLRNDAAAAVTAARVAAEKDRATAVEAARAGADLEAAKIVADGEAAAQRDSAGGRRPADRKDEVLAAVLEGFADQ